MSEQLRQDALRIWRAGVEAVGAERLVREWVHADGDTLQIGDERLDLASIRRIVIVGAGKAGAGMAAAVEEVLGPKRLADMQVTGWVNVPDDCVRPLAAIHLHGARPAGRNEPTPEGAAGAERILKLVSELTAGDLCLCLLSGGGSALLPAPAEGIALADKLAVTRHLSAAGANIEELNTVRKQLSRIKGGGLLRACRAGRLVTLVISDVIGDDLQTIASGPTVEDRSTPAEALAILEKYDARSAGIGEHVFAYLRSQRNGSTPRPTTTAQSFIIGNLATAVDAAGREAERLGYEPAMQTAATLEGPAEEIGVHLAEMALSMRDRGGPDCLISGGEPIVRLVDAPRRGLGGRNQQLVLAAAKRLAAYGARGIVLLSGGTDGEDGPTDAAGAILDEPILTAANRKGLDPQAFLERNDAYHFFEPLIALIKTGPTNTNVGDLRVIVVRRDESTKRNLIE